MHCGLASTRLTCSWKLSAAPGVPKVQICSPAPDGSAEGSMTRAYGLVKAAFALRLKRGPSNGPVFGPKGQKGLAAPRGVRLAGRVLVGQCHPQAVITGGCVELFELAPVLLHTPNTSQRPDSLQ